MSPRSVTRIAAIGLALAALAGPAAAAAHDDHRTPDARAAGHVARPADDLRSPDSRVAATPPLARSGDNVDQTGSGDGIGAALALVAVVGMTGLGVGLLLRVRRRPAALPR
jgi:hypothetical protein